MHLVLRLEQQRGASGDRQHAREGACWENPSFSPCDLTAGAEGDLEPCQWSWLGSAWFIHEPRLKKGAEHQGWDSLPALAPPLKPSFAVKGSSIAPESSQGQKKLKGAEPNGLNSHIHVDVDVDQQALCPAGRQRGRVTNICCWRVLCLRSTTSEGKTGASPKSCDYPGEMAQLRAQWDRGCFTAEDAHCPSWEICVGSCGNTHGGHLGVPELQGQRGSARAGLQPGFF